MKRSMTTSEQETVRKRFARLRLSYPKWSSAALLRKFWPNRRVGVSGREIFEIAMEFERDDRSR